MRESYIILCNRVVRSVSYSISWICSVSFPFVLLLYRSCWKISLKCIFNICCLVHCVICDIKGSAHKLYIQTETSLNWTFCRFLPLSFSMSQVNVPSKHQNLYLNLYLAFMVADRRVHLLLSQVVYLWGGTTLDTFLFLSLEFICHHLDRLCPLIPLEAHTKPIFKKTLLHTSRILLRHTKITSGSVINVNWNKLDHFTLLKTIWVNHKAVLTSWQYNLIWVGKPPLSANECLPPLSFHLSCSTTSVVENQWCIHVFEHVLV